MTQGDTVRHKVKHYTVRPSAELDEKIQVVSRQWLAKHPKHTMNDWWCEAAGLMCDGAVTQGEAVCVTVSQPESAEGYEEREEEMRLPAGVTLGMPGKREKPKLPGASGGVRYVPFEEAT